MATNLLFPLFVVQSLFYRQIEGEVTQNSQNSWAQEEHCPSHLTGRAGGHSSLHVRKAWDHPLLLRCSRAVRRMQQHKPTTSSTCEAAACARTAPEVPGLWRKRDLSETVPFRLATDFANEDDELGPASVTHQLRTAPFFSAPCHFQACSTLIHGSRLSVSCSGRRTHERRVHCQLSSFEKRQPIHHPPRASLVSNWLTTPKSKSRTKTYV